MYELISENLTGLGGPMGTERTWENWRLFFRSLENAKAYAEADYGKPINWRERSINNLSSPDLSYVMYHINQVKTED